MRVFLALALIASSATAQDVYTYEPPVAAQEDEFESEAPAAAPQAAEPVVTAETETTAVGTEAGQQSDNYSMREVLQAADGAFGEASAAVGKVIEKVFADLGEPNGYIVGREGSGAFVLGLRYGQGTLYSKIEGERTVHWTGPSVGFDAGGDVSRTFTLVYNLYDTEELFHRFPAVEGRVYLLGGVSANYHQRRNIILVPIRLGAGWRLGANVGYLRYSKTGRVIPF